MAAPIANLTGQITSHFAGNRDVCCYSIRPVRNRSSELGSFRRHGSPEHRARRHSVLHSGRARRADRGAALQRTGGDDAGGRKFLFLCGGIAEAFSGLAGGLGGGTGNLVTASTIAVGWSSCLSGMLEQFGIRLPEKFAQAPVSLSESMAITVTGGYGNFPAALVTLALTGLLALGIRESAGFNTGVSLIKIAVILAVVAVGIF